MVNSIELLYLVGRFVRGTFKVARIAASGVGFQVVAFVRQLGAIVSDSRTVHQERVLVVDTAKHIVGLETGAARGHH